MTQFTVNPQRVDPYKNFKFRVVWDGKVVAGVSEISALRRVTDVVVHREGGDPSAQHKSPGLTAYDPIVLRRGVTHDTAFEAWANLVWQLGGQAEVSLAHFRKNVVIDLFNEAGQRVLSYLVHRCWPSEYVAVGNLDANNGAVAIETLVLQNEGWERDTSVTEPKEP
jgi:phage tail-like protein